MSRALRQFIAVCLGVRCAAAPFAIEVEVVDESGTPLAGAAVSCETLPRLALDPWNAPARRVVVSATADERGRAHLSGDHALPELIVTAVAPGFHAAARRTVIGINIARVVLPSRLGASKSMCFELLTRALPDDGGEHGFDLVLGAFTAPLGVGKHPDVYLRGRCPSVALPPRSTAPYTDEALMRFAHSADGVIAVPRPGQTGFAASISPACKGMFIPSLVAPRLAPEAGYTPSLAYRSSRGLLPNDVPGPGRIDSPQWVFRLTRESGCLHGVLTDFGWLPDGRLRIAYRISSEPGNRSLDFGP